MAELSPEIIALVASYHCKKLNALKYNSTVHDNFHEIIQSENNHDGDYKVLYQGLRSYITNLYLFAELIMELTNKKQYYYKGTYDGTVKVPNNKICTVSNLFKNIDYPEENIFDCMNNNGPCKRYNFSLLDDKTNTFDIDSVLKDLMQGGYINESHCNELKKQFEIFDNDNKHSHMLMVYNIPLKMFNDMQHTYYSPNEKCYYLTDEFPLGNNFHASLTNFNPNKPGIKIQQYYNVYAHCLERHTLRNILNKN